MSMEDFKKETYDLVNVILGCDIIATFNDRLKGTIAYRQKLKFHSTGLNEEVEAVLEKYRGRVFESGEEIYTNVARNLETYIENMSKNMVNMRPDDFLELNQIIELYINNREKFQENFDITLKSIHE